MALSLLVLFLYGMMGMRDSAFQRWQAARGQALRDSTVAMDVSGGFSTLTRTLRLFLQSAMLGLCAYLTLAGEVTGGAMIASSILMGRARRLASSGPQARVSRPWRGC